MKFSRRARTRPVINIAPLVDVVFLLVIFFAVSTTFLETAGLKLELPESNSATERPPRDMVVLLAEDGTMSFNGETLDPDRLEDRLRRALEDQDRKVVMLKADAAARHGDVVRAMDVIRSAGAEQLSVGAQPAPN